MFVVTDGLWSFEKPKVLKLGVLPVKAMLAVEEHLWASSGGQVFIISTHTHCVEVCNVALILLGYLHTVCTSLTEQFSRSLCVCGVNKPWYVPLYLYCILLIILLSLFL